MAEPQPIHDRRDVVGTLGGTLDIRVAFAGYRTSWWPVSPTGEAWVWEHRNLLVLAPHGIEHNTTQETLDLYHFMIDSGLRVGVDEDTLLTFEAE